MTTMRWAQLAAARLLKGRSTQCTWMHTFGFQTYLEDYLRETGLGQFMRGEEAQAVLSQGLIAQWEQGERYVLSTSATAAAFSAAESLWGEITPPVAPDDLPGFTGLAFLDRTLYAKNPAGDQVGISAVSWSPCYAGPGDPGILLATWTHKDAEGDQSLARVRNAWRTAQRILDEEDEEIATLRRALRHDAEADPAELASLNELLAQRTRQARTTRAQMGRAAAIPEYVLLDLQPLPFGKEYGTNGGLSHRTREAEVTTSLDAVASDSSSMVIRLPIAIWGLLSQGALRSTVAPLSPDIERKFAKKRLPHEVLALQVDGAPDAQDLLTVHRSRMPRVGRAQEWGESLQWKVEQPLVARAMG